MTIDWKARHEDLAEAAKDLPFALVALQEQKLPKAVLNMCVALVRTIKHLSELEHRELLDALQELKDRIAARDIDRNRGKTNEAGQGAAEGEPTP
jgi:hypothetical protein